LGSDWNQEEEKIMVTGFEMDAQFIAKEQVRATNRLAHAIEELVKVLRDQK
jgi:hypothetical protein